MRALLPILLLGALSCGDPTLTEIFVCYEIDPELVSAATTTRVCALDDSGAVLAGCDEGTRTRLGQDGERRSQGFVQGGSERLVIALEGNVPRSVPGGIELREISQSIDIAFAEGRTIDVTLRLENACLDRVCPDDETCVEGRCTPLRIANERCLTDHGDEPDPLCAEMEPRLTRGCPAP